VFIRRGADIRVDGGDDETEKAHLLGTLELEVGGDRDGEEVLVRVDNRVHDGCNGGDTGSERDGGNGLDTRHETVEEGLFLDVENLGRKDGTVVVDHGDGHTVGEGRNVEHVQQSSLGRSDLVSGSNDLDVLYDFNRTSSNLCWDFEGLEERGLSGLHTSVSTGNDNVVGGDSTCSGRGSDNVGNNDFSNILQVARGKDESNVALDVGEELLELGVFGKDDSETSSDHGVFTHEHDTLSSERLSDQVGLLGRDIVNVDNEDGG
jgi:hypothetical protein